MSLKKTQWRATGAYQPTLASKSSLLEETRMFLEAYTHVSDTEEASQSLINGVLLQRSRRTRATIVQIIRMRLVRWTPPTWVLTDLVAFAKDKPHDVFCLALLLHIARQDVLLYDFIQQVIVPHWYAGTTKIIRSDVQTFLDAAQEEHTEIKRWSHSTREKLSRNLLTVLRDCKLLKGEVNKYIILPTVPTLIAHHLIHLLQAEGIAPEHLAQHPDWQLWLWDITQAQKAIDSYVKQEYMV